MKPPVSFNQLVYALVRHIPYGKVLNYGRVAQLLDTPYGAREVGWALAALRDDAQGVPWHRVVNAQGQISIKGSPEGAAHQRALLESEGIVFDEHDRLDMQTHLWDPPPWVVEEILRAARGAPPEE